MVGELLRKGAAASDLRPALEQRQRLLLDRVGVGQVLDHLVGEVIRLERRDRGLDGGVEAGRDPAGHAALLLADLTRGGGDVWRAGALADAGEQLVEGELEMLVGVGVGRELAGGVGLELREQREPDAGSPSRQILDRRGLGVALVEKLAHPSLRGPTRARRLASDRAGGRGSFSSQYAGMLLSPAGALR